MEELERVGQLVVVGEEFCKEKRERVVKVVRVFRRRGGSRTRASCEGQDEKGRGEREM